MDGLLDRLADMSKGHSTPRRVAIHRLRTAVLEIGRGRGLS